MFKDISAKHSGKYTCYASNAAAKVNYTAELQVRGKNHLKIYCLPELLQNVIEEFKSMYESF